MAVTQLADIYDIVVDLLADDAAITAYCQAQYATDHKVYLGVNVQNPPDQSDCPFIVIYGIYRDRNAQPGFYQFTLDFAVYIAQAAEDTVDNKVTLRGIKEVEALRQLAEDALFEKKTGLGRLEADGETDMEIIYPLFRADTLLKISYPLSRR